MGKIFDGIIGLVVGDALGVPVEFKKRDTFQIVDMIGHGTYNQLPGTWSDDSSLTLATLESIGRLGKIDPVDIMQNFHDWLFGAGFTPYNEVFDVGGGTRRAIQRYAKGTSPLNCGGRSRIDNGNGSLMRILPLAFVEHTPVDVMNVSSLTHAHEISKAACLIYIAIADELLAGVDKETAIQNGFNKVQDMVNMPNEFAKIPVIGFVNRDFIKSSGYVVDTLEAALWCVLHGTDYKSTVLMAVNLGEDTDTVAAVAGGLAGIIYGADDIPLKWLAAIPRFDWILGLCNILENKLSK